MSVLLGLLNDGSQQFAGEVSADLHEVVGALLQFLPLLLGLRLHMSGLALRNLLVQVVAHLAHSRRQQSSQGCEGTIEGFAGQCNALLDDIRVVDLLSLQLGAVLGDGGFDLFTLDGGGVVDESSSVGEDFVEGVDMGGVGQERQSREALVEMGEDIGDGVCVDEAEEVDVGVDAVVEAVEVDEVDGSRASIVKFGDLAGARSEESLLPLQQPVHEHLLHLQQHHRLHLRLAVPFHPQNQFANCTVLQCIIPITFIRGFRVLSRKVGLRFRVGRVVLGGWGGGYLVGGWGSEVTVLNEIQSYYFDQTIFALQLSEMVWSGLEGKGRGCRCLLQLSYKVYNSWMNRWLNLLTLSFTSTPAQTVQKSLRDLNLPSLDALPHDYLDRLLTKDHPAPTLFAEIVKQLPQQTAPPAVIKLLAFLFSAIRQSNYDSSYLLGLQGLQPLGVEKGEGGDEQWVREVAVSCRSYLARLPSVGDLFQRAVTAVKNERSTGELSDLYRLMNVVGLLFPHLNSALNTIGRYYMKSSPYFLEFYRALREELLLGYGYLRLLVDYFLSNYTAIDALTLDCFMHSLPEIELLCDRVEEFLMNKYFKGRAPPRKIYFQQEKIDEIAYYLGRQKEGAEEELFGEYQ